MIPFTGSSGRRLGSVPKILKRAILDQRHQGVITYMTRPGRCRNLSWLPLRGAGKSQDENKRQRFQDWFHHRVRLRPPQKTRLRRSRVIGKLVIKSES
jgi:hypothetical protein